MIALGMREMTEAMREDTMTAKMTKEATIGEMTMENMKEGKEGKEAIKKSEL